MSSSPAMFVWSAQTPADAQTAGLARGFTGRGGPWSSETPYGAGNLGGHVGDDPEAVERRRLEVAGAMGVERDHLVFMNQCHGADIEVVEGPWAGPAPQADGVVTRRTDLALAVLVADCTPVLLADRAAGVVGAVHAGRPGMLEGIIGRALGAMRELGATAIEAVVGPSVCGRCYEVPEEMRARAAARSAVSATVSWTGTPAIDVAAGVVDQLRADDVAVQWIPGCTRESDDLFSYRRDGTTGRFAGVIRLLPERGETSLGNVDFLGSVDTLDTGWAGRAHG